MFFKQTAQGEEVMVMKTFLGDAVELIVLQKQDLSSGPGAGNTDLWDVVKTIVLPKPDLSSGPGAGYTDKYYRHLHRPDPFDRRMMEKVIPDRIICDNMGHIVGMK